MLPILKWESYQTIKHSIMNKLINILTIVLIITLLGSIESSVQDKHMSGSVEMNFTDNYNKNRLHNILNICVLYRNKTDFFVTQRRF